MINNSKQNKTKYQIVDIQIMAISDGLVEIVSWKRRMIEACLAIYNKAGTSYKCKRKEMSM